jgi:uncharacterized protein
MIESELDRLDQFLAAPERIDSALPLDAIQGLFAAIACASEPVSQEKWLREVLGEPHAFASDDEAKEITALLTRFGEETARQLNEGEGFDFILYGPEGEEDLAAWAEGYLLGVDLADPPWDEGAETEDLDNMLYPFLALTGQAKDMAIAAGEEWMSEDDEKKMLAEVRESLADHLIDVRQYWFDKSIPPTVKREGLKVGRNDPCPCGSGKKYKNCHGK